jgi:hypothetical protein
VAELESPDEPSDLYRYRGEEVNRARPLFQGDVFTNIMIPGLEDEHDLAIVLTHPCTMRAGSALRERVVVARVRSDSAMALPWRGHFSKFPLPDLLPNSAPGHWAALFDDIGTVPTQDLLATQRIACLDDRGVVLLQQRHAHSFTRHVVETEVLYEQCSGNLVEAELLEAWLEAGLIAVGDEEWQEEHSRLSEEFDVFFAEHRAKLDLASNRPGVRRAVRKEIAQRFASIPVDTDRTDS